jgi:hypothetical protein
VPSTTKTTTLSMTSTSSLQLTLHQQVRVNNFLAFSRRLRTVRYPKDFKPAIEKYNGRSDLSIWLKMDNIAACASGGNEDHMAGYFPIVMGKAPLLWLDNLLAECTPPRQRCLAFSQPTTRRPTTVLATLTTSPE